MLYSRPIVRLLSQTVRPFADVVSSARTCYSGKGIVLPSDVLDAVAQEPEANDRYHGILSSIYQAGHHTTFQHSYLHFAIENVSRQAIWSFLHSHTFYNSEQVSQRYVKVKKDQLFVPQGLNQAQLDCLQDCYEFQIKAYHEMGKMLAPVTEAEYLKRFKSRRGSKRAEKDIQKKCQEIARYVLPLGTTAYLHHTVAFLTVLRYIRLCQMPDVPMEQKMLAEAMLASIRELDPEVDRFVQMPLDSEEIFENQLLSQTGCDMGKAARFQKQFDQDLGGRISKMVDYKVNQCQSLAASIREVMGLLPNENFSDSELIHKVLSSETNSYLKESLNLGTHSKLMRTLMHASYSFRKKISHAADSQDQRHRMTPGSRPLLQTHFSGEPDYIVPLIVKQDDLVLKRYEEIQNQIWEKVNQAIKLGMSYEQFSYMLPNALSVRFSESGDLLALKHKMNMRLCYNAQEEIWQASLEEALQISEVHPEIGIHLLPPCSVRYLGGQRPICPEGERFCGVPVWKLTREQYQRSI